MTPSTCMRTSAEYECFLTLRWPSASRTLSETCEAGAHTRASARAAPLARARVCQRWGRAAYSGVLPGPLELERGHLAAEAVHEGDHLPRPVLARLPRAAEDLAVVLAHAARRVDREADIGRAARAEALQEVAAAQPRLFLALRALGRTVGGARRCLPLRTRDDGPAARHAASPAA